MSYGQALGWMHPVLTLHSPHDLRGAADEQHAEASQAAYPGLGRRFCDLQVHRIWPYYLSSVTGNPVHL